ncbi:LEM domain-containing protein 2 isoform X2 [Eleutherodactylus coqui]|uniref:LEM domain-containing protein 2 isoform X2 n=1 Tax=Eleutherodactylus coqui TaxID=57060 RepID=UPI00346205D9
MGDEKLRRELIAFGYTPGPVTDSTRRVLEKKLWKLHADSTKTRNSRGKVRRNHHNDNADEESWKPSKERASWGTMREETGLSQEERSWWADERVDDSRYPGRNISSSARTHESTLWKSERVSLPGHNPQRISLDRYRYSGDPSERSSLGRHRYSADEHVGDIIRELSTSQSLSSSRTAVDPPSYKTLAGIKQESVSHFKSSWSKQLEHYLSRLLRGLCIILLLVFTGILIVKSGILSTSQDNDMKLLPSSCEGRKDTFCTIKQKEIHLQILSELYDFLSLEAGSFECGNPSGLRSKCVPINQAKEHLMNASGYAAEKLDAALEWMLSSDRHLGIWAKGEDSEELVTMRADIFCLESARPRLGFVCRLKNALYTAISNLFLALLDHVKHHYKDWTFGREQNPYVGILHVRDSLIIPQDRKCLKKVWDRAVQFVEDNESRVRTELQRVAGADLRVWRWTQTRI